MINLTEEEKKYHLKFLNEQCEKGCIDTELTEYLKQINQLNGICTTQSCTGHEQGEVQSDGEIRLRLSPECECSFENKLIILLACRNITQVGTVYHGGSHYTKGAIPDGIYQEFCIHFLGMNRDKLTFKHSIETILDFLKSIEEKRR